MEALFTARLEEAVARYRWPGCAAVLVRLGHPAVLRTWGWADLRARRPVTEETGFRIGSTGKTLTGLALTSLVEQGALGLDDLVQEHLPGYRLDLPGVRLRHLVSHTAGLGELLRWGDVTRARAGAGVRPGRPRPSLHDLYGGGVPVAGPPGLLWRYANHGIALAGAVVEAAAGAEFSAAMDKLVLGPLGMDGTGFGPEWIDDPRTATGHGTGRRTGKPVPVLDIAVAPAGSAVSRASDLATYLTALLADGSPAAMLEPLHQPDPRQTGTGVVWWLDRLDGHRVARHGGAWSGFRSCLLVAPDDGVAMWFGINAEDDAVEQVGLALLRDLLGARPADEELAHLVGSSSGSVALPPEGHYLPVGTALSTITSWTQHPRGLAVRHREGVASIAGGGSWRDGFPLLHVGGDDPTLFAASLGQADHLSKGFTTVKVMGTPSQPVLLVNGRAPYVRTRSARPWTPIEALQPATREQLERLCVSAPG